MYMPQYNNGESWNDIWFSPTDYETAKSIRNMFLRNDTSRDDIRIAWVPANYSIV